MKTKVFLISSFITTLLLSSCNMHIIKGDGNLVTNHINVSDYSKIDMNGGNVEFIYQQKDSAPSFEITVDENIRKVLEIKVEDGKLIIRPNRRGMNLHPSTFIIKTSSHTLNKLNFAGSGKFSVEGPFKSSQLEMDMAGSGNINLLDSAWIDNLKLDLAGSGKFGATYLQGNEFKGEIAGSGTINLAGKVRMVSLDIAGSGDVNAFDCEIYDLNSDIAGSGNVDATVIHSIKSSVAGSGKVRYKGPVTQIESKNMGSGSVTRVN